MQTVLVDLDGTLIDSSEGVVNCINYALEAYGLSTKPKSELLKYIGPPLSFSFGDLGVAPEDIETCVAKYRERYKPIGIMEACVYEGVPEMLKAIRQAGKTLIVATSKPETLAKTILGNFGIADLFDDICGADDSVNRKTKQAVLEYIIDKHHIENLDDCILIGDTKYDVEGANAVGIKTCGILYGFGDRESLEKEGAAYVVETAMDAAELVCRL